MCECLPAELPSWRTTRGPNTLLDVDEVISRSPQQIGLKSSLGSSMLFPSPLALESDVVPWILKPCGVSFVRRQREEPVYTRPPIHDCATARIIDSDSGETLGLVNAGYAVRFSNHPPSPLLASRDRAMFKAFSLTHRAIELETRMCNYTNMAENLQKSCPTFRSSALTAKGPSSGGGDTVARTSIGCEIVAGGSCGRAQRHLLDRLVQCKAMRSRRSYNRGSGGRNQRSSSGLLRRCGRPYCGRIQTRALTDEEEDEDAGS
ncbi:hypothetical protein OE88DRAFT_1645539 [Heliocybe sulcata]|uniref:Uncharacterized protein n=1 Tax=Heliocybe sulcata TaxID=5364 RepID=A0A5C3N256_9AGAM|nr:hypothetical protein OE88DRAFT_1645539 [Heliocybe sulcata]